MPALSASSPFAARTADPLDAAGGWMTGLLTGSLAIGLCVLAVAFVGLLMLGGRLDVRHGLRVVLGCFVLLGAPLIASVFVGGTQTQTAAQPVAQAPLAVEEPRGELPPANYDPYAGASLRRD